MPGGFIGRYFSPIVAHPKSYKSWLLSPLHKAERQVSIYMETQLKDIGVSAAEGHLLSYVARYGPCAVGELVRVLGIRRTTMTSMLDRMEQRGLIDRNINADDRRSFMVGITPAGLEIVDRCGKIVEGLEKKVRRLLSRAASDGLQEVFSVIDGVTHVDVRGK